MPNLSVVPFGKYKGQPVEVMAQDQEYCEWLTEQDWFRTRYTAIHTLIVNNFSQPHETPEHNALQVRFTDKEWCKVFLWAFLGERYWQNLLRQEQMRAISRREKDIQACQSIIQKNTDRLVNIGDKPDSQAYERYRKKFVYDHANEVFIAPLTEEDWLKSTTNHWNLSIRSPTREITDAQSELARLNLAYKARLDWLESSPVPVLEILELLFEVEGADVQFRFNVSTDMPDNCRFKSYFNWNDHSCVTFSHISNNYHLRIECKPVIGDDYPAVLRQMKANSCDVLLIGHGGYRGVGATSKQMEQIFAASGIKVMLLSQIND